MPVNTVAPRIHKLSTNVINQIAAGEVIERPASVVKELVENSIDAVAKNIYVDIEQAGWNLTRIRDDGQGIYKDDLKLALQNHATSKLSAFSDLSEIVSLGFRGEALSSIASISRCKIVSRYTSDENAWSIDNQLILKPASHVLGTTVEVRDLFYSTPARRKFLKSLRVELLHVKSIINMIALGHFSVGFFCNHSEQNWLRLPACDDDPQQRVLKIYGRSFLHNSILIDIEKNAMRLWGWIGLAGASRSQSDRQYFYINGRSITDKYVKHAVRLAYSDRLPPGRYPSYILYLQIEPARVDVNVHPTKSEVRFAEPRDIHDFIYASVLEHLNKPMLPIPKYRPTSTSPIADKQHDEANQYYVKSYPKTKLNQKDWLKEETSPHYLNLFNGRFLIASLETQQLLIDIIKAEGVLAVHHLLKNYRAKTVVKRPILIPLSFTASAAQIELVQTHSDIINHWGFELGQISPTQISVRALPTRLLYADVLSLTKSLLTALTHANSDIDIAQCLASHIYDARAEFNEESAFQLIREILNFKPAYPQTKLPWCQLTPESLHRLLEN